MPTKQPPKGNAVRTRRAPKKDWREQFILNLADGGHVMESAKLAGVGRRTVYDERQRNEEFALQWADAIEVSTELLEKEAQRRAVDGVEEPIYYKGDEVGRVRKYSDTLLIFLLKGRRPDVYRDGVKVEHSGTVKHDVVVDVVPDEERREEVARILSGVLGDGGFSG